MALERSIAKSSITANCETVTITETTGDYNVTTNPTGYGAPNETRANLYIAFFLTFKPSDGDEAIEIDAYDPNTVASWEVGISRDGYYEAYSLACLAYGGGITYETDYVTYDTATELFYKSLQDSNTGNAVSDTDWWEAIEDVDDLKAAVVAEQPDIYAAFYEWIEVCNSTHCRNKLAVKNAEGDMNNPGANQETKGKADRVNDLLIAAVVHDAGDTFSQGQRVIELIENECGCIDEGED